MTTMSITRALAEVKMLDKRIVDAINTGLFASVAYGNAKRPHLNHFKTSEEVLSRSAADFKSVEDLISRRTKIKAKILESNGKTVVRIGNKDMTVAEAIDSKEVVKYKQFFLNKMKTEVANASGVVAASRQKMEVAIQNQQNAVAGGDAKTLSKEALDSVANAIKDQLEPVMISGVDINKVIQRLEAEISDFQLNVDYVLSESNSKTTIEVE